MPNWMLEYSNVRVQLAGSAGRRYETFSMPRRYANCEFIGQGSYGCVIACDDLASGRSVAVKKIRNIDKMQTEDLRNFSLTLTL